MSFVCAYSLFKIMNYLNSLLIGTVLNLHCHLHIISKHFVVQGRRLGAGETIVFLPTEYFL
jgi:hypothetical protein